jgi:hypothetical protein
LGATDVQSVTVLRHDAFTSQWRKLKLTSVN